MTIPIDELIVPATRDEVLADLLAIAALLGQPTTSWQEGSALLTALMTVSQKISDETLTDAEIAKGGFGDLLPSDAWADLWAQSRFNVQRVAAVSASGYETFTADATAAANTYAAGEIILAHATTHKVYRNAAPVTIAPSSTIADQPIVADEPGIASNAAPGTITVMVSSLVGVTVTNPLSVLGSDRETTLALVLRARAKLGALSPNGPKDAYNYVATTPELSATSVPITRTRTVASETTGAISVYLATASGAPSGADVAIVQTAIDAFAEPWGATATAIAATTQTVNITYQAWVSGSQLTSAQIQTAIANALAVWFSTLAIGGYVIPPDTGAVYVDALEQIIGQSTPGILRVVVSVPASDVALTANKVAVLGTITSTITIL